jgi:hypothetical protein
VSLSGDQVALYPVGRRVRLLVGGVARFASVASSSHVSGTTTLTLVGIVDSAGSASTIASNPTEISYAPLLTGATGNSQQVFDALRLRADAGVLRLMDTGASGKEFGLRSDGGLLEILENTGTEATPSWTVRASVDAAGISIANGAITLAKLANGTANRVIGFDGTGVPLRNVDPMSFCANACSPSGMLWLCLSARTKGLDKTISPNCILPVRWDAVLHRSTN